MARSGRHPWPFVGAGILAGCSLFRLFGDERFVESFDEIGTIEEAGAMEQSASDEWWVSSGGRLVLSGGVGSTIQGDAGASDRWRAAYASADPSDTDGGVHPQNLFRLVTRRKWRDAQQTLRFRIRALQPSASPNRNETNGVHLLHRYRDGDNLYYMGLRVDGAAVIKKKLGGTYTTLAYRKLYEGQYDRERTPALLPLDRWLGLQTVIQDDPGGGVGLAMRLEDPGRGGGWVEVVQAVDRGEGGPPLATAGFAGIRTDFADVEFDEFAVEPLPPNR